MTERAIGHQVVVISGGNAGVSLATGAVGYDHVVVCPASQALRAPRLVLAPLLKGAA